MCAAHSIFGQKLLQVHVLKLEEASICRQAAIPQERPQELVEASSSISTSSTAITVITADYSTSISHGAHSQGVLIKVQSVFVCQRKKFKKAESLMQYKNDEAYL